MQPTDPSSFDRLLFAVGVAITWLSGEAGKAIIAGAAGGFYRWLMAERRRLRDGVVAVVSGAISASYLGPVALAILRLSGLKIDDGPDIYLTSGFLAGLAGMSIAKLVVALIEAQASKLRGKS